MHPCPKSIRSDGIPFLRPTRLRLIRGSDFPGSSHDLALFREDALDVAGLDSEESGSAGYPVRIERDESLGKEAYRLSLRPDECVIASSDSDGCWWGMQTLLQILALDGRMLTPAVIEDRPRYSYRGLMIDMGRAPWPWPFLKRIVRILSRLKMNTLHLHLYDDHLCSLRFQSLPLGLENPYSITPGRMGELVNYARRRHVAIVPELEAWGHAGSIIRSLPHLRGAPGMWEGQSFGIGEELYELIQRMLDEVVPQLEREADVHMGLDEAGWELLPSATGNASAYSPATHVARIHDLLQKCGARHGRKLRMRCWADHKGIDIPPDLRRKIVIEPWNYFWSGETDIRSKVERYSGSDKQLFILGAGMSSQHLQGTCDATRIWCREARNSPNALGPNICHWEGNDLPGRFIGLFGGAGYAWNPNWGMPEEKDIHGENLRGLISRRMKRWQSVFSDADDAAMRLDRGWEVYRGVYTEGPLAGQPVTPFSALSRDRSENSLTF
ncbi:MAG: family 20 glycosylhydrolase [Kiritimatiellia bacterium]|nr:family 20 glycosylhydrolase [Kiritimatiellia bacterium]